jgi:hypothetical protein
VAQGRDRARLSDKSGDGLGALCAFNPGSDKDLERDVAMQTRIEGAVDATHSSRTELDLDSVAIEHCSFSQHRRKIGRSF